MNSLSTSSTKMAPRNTSVAETPDCTHENNKKAKKFFKKCALCHTRVWKFWKAKKCIDCKSIVHRSCLAAAREKENARKSTEESMTAKTDASTPATVAVALSTERLVGGERYAPMYVTPTLRLSTLITAVLIDCRRRPEPLTVVVNHGGELTARMLMGLFDLLPVQRRRTPAREVDSTKTGPTQPPRHELQCLDWCTETQEAGDTGQTTRPSDGTRSNALDARQRTCN